MLDFGLGDSGTSSSNVSFGNFDYTPSFDFSFGSGNSFATDGQIGITQRANDSFLGFDQSKISSSIFDVMSSVVKTSAQAVGNVAGKALGNAINPSVAQQPFLRNFFSSFSSTPTGKAVQNQAILGNVQGMFMSPVVWLISGVAILAIVLMRR